MCNVFRRTGSVLIFLLSAGMTAYGVSDAFAQGVNAAPAVPYQGYTLANQAAPAYQAAPVQNVSPVPVQRTYPKLSSQVVGASGYQTAAVADRYASGSLPPAPAAAPSQAPLAAPVQAPIAAPIQAESYYAEPEYTEGAIVSCDSCASPWLGRNAFGNGCGSFAGCQAESGCCPSGAFCQTGLLPPEAKRFGKLFFDGWVSAGGSTHNEWPISATAYEPGTNSDFQMNQFYVSLGREVSRCGQWDIGGKVDLLYGTDYLLVSSLGLESYNTGDRGQPVSTVYHARPHWNSDNGSYPEYGVAMPQAYAEVYAPMAAGLSVKMGHFYSPMGYESICSPSNFFYTHTYTMMYGEPQTVTGVLADLHLNNSWSLLGGFSQGWNVWEDNNDAMDVMGGFKWDSCDRRSALSMMVMSGDTVYSNSGEPFNAALTNYSIVFERKLSPLLSWVFQHDLGIAEDGAWAINPNGSVQRLDAHWYSITNYLYYQMSPTLSLGFRAEWFKDEDHSRMGDGNTRGLLFDVTGDNYVDLSLGLNWKPNCWLTIRPEVRWDYSDVEIKNIQTGRVMNKAFGKNFDKDDLVTVGGDVVVRF